MPTIVKKFHNESIPLIKNTININIPASKQTKVIRYSQPNVHFINIGRPISPLPVTIQRSQPEQVRAISNHIPGAIKINESQKLEENYFQNLINQQE
jgi:hypothetical protein